MLSEKDVLQLFEKSGGILKGHFLLTSGRHSGQYMQCAKLFIDTEISEKLCSALSSKFDGEKIDTVISPAIGGILMGYEMARQLKSKNIFAERDNGVMSLRRGFSIAKGEKVLVVEDVVTTGGSVKEVVKLVQELGGEVIAVASIVDRSGGKAEFGVRYESLIKIDIASYEADECPLCKSGEIQLNKPGSRTFNKK